MNSDWITYNGADLALCLLQPNLTEQPELMMMVDRARLTKAISARESRQRFARTALYDFSYTGYLSDARASEDFRLWLLRLKGETVAVPLWEDGAQLSLSAAAGDVSLAKTSDLPARSGAAWIILNADASLYEILTVTFVGASELDLATPLANNWPAGSRIFPLLFGRFADRPELKSWTGERGAVSLHFHESSDYTQRLTPPVVSLPTVGANITAFATMPLWTMQPNWVEPMEQSEVDVLYESLGFLRTEQQYVYDQPVRRGYEMNFKCRTRAEIVALERFFWDRFGPTKPFFLPTFRNDLVLTADLPNGSDAQLVSVQGSRYLEAAYDQHPGAPYLAFVGPAPNGVVDPHKITLIDIAGLHTQAAVTLAHAAALTRTTHLVLARFAETTLRWSYITPTRADCTIKFIEVPDEYVTPNAELPERARLYRFTEQRNPADPATWVANYFTSYENAIAYGGHSYQPAPFSHGEIPNLLSLDDKVTLKSFDFPTNPLRKILTQRLEGNLQLDLIDVSVTEPDDGSARIWFSGQVSNLDPTGKQWKAEVAWRKRLLDRVVPRVFKQAVCNTSCYSEYCTLKEVDFKVSGLITLLSGQTVQVAAGAALPANWFAAGGKIVRGMGTTSFEQRGILTSTPIAGGVKLMIDQPFYLAAVGNAADVVPTCSRNLDDDTGRSCIAWHNRENFRAFAYLPNELLNPAGQSAQTAGGKK